MLHFFSGEAVKLENQEVRVIQSEASQPVLPELPAQKSSETQSLNTVNTNANSEHQPQASDQAVSKALTPELPTESSSSPDETSNLSAIETSVNCSIDESVELGSKEPVLDQTVSHSDSGPSNLSIQSKTDIKSPALESSLASQKVNEQYPESEMTTSNSVVCETDDNIINSDTESAALKKTNIGENQISSFIMEPAILKPNPESKQEESTSMDEAVTATQMDGDNKAEMTAADDCDLRLTEIDEDTKSAFVQGPNTESGDKKQGSDKKTSALETGALETVNKKEDQKSTSIVEPTTENPENGDEKSDNAEDPGTATPIVEDRGNEEVSASENINRIENESSTTIPEPEKPSSRNGNEKSNRVVETKTATPIAEHVGDEVVSTPEDTNYKAEHIEDDKESTSVQELETENTTTKVETDESPTTPELASGNEVNEEAIKEPVSNSEPMTAETVNDERKNDLSTASEKPDSDIKIPTSIAESAVFENTNKADDKPSTSIPEVVTDTPSSENGNEESNNIVETVTTTPIVEHAGDEVVSTPEDTIFKAEHIEDDKESASVQELETENTTTNVETDESPTIPELASGNEVNEEAIKEPVSIPEPITAEMVNDEGKNDLSTATEKPDSDIKIPTSIAESAVFENTNKADDKPSTSIPEVVTDTPSSENGNEESNNIVETVITTPIVEHAGDEVASTPEDTNLKAEQIEDDKESTSVQELETENAKTKVETDESPTTPELASGNEVNEEAIKEPVSIPEPITAEAVNEEGKNGLTEKPDSEDDTYIPTFIPESAVLEDTNKADDKPSTTIPEPATETPSYGNGNEESNSVVETVTPIAEYVGDEVISTPKDNNLKPDQIEEDKESMSVHELEPENTATKVETDESSTTPELASGNEVNEEAIKEPVSISEPITAEMVVNDEEKNDLNLTEKPDSEDDTNIPTSIPESAVLEDTNKADDNPSTTIPQPATETPSSENGNEESDSVVETVTLTPIAEHVGNEVVYTPEDNNLKPDQIEEDKESMSVHDLEIENTATKVETDESSTTPELVSGNEVNEETIKEPISTPEPMTAETVNDEGKNDSSEQPDSENDTKIPPYIPESAVLEDTNKADDKPSTTIPEPVTETPCSENGNEESNSVIETVTDAQIAEHAGDEQVYTPQDDNLKAEQIEDDKESTSVHELETENATTKVETDESRNTPESASGNEVNEEAIKELVSTSEPIASETVNDVGKNNLSVVSNQLESEKYTKIPTFIPESAGLENEIKADDIDKPSTTIPDLANETPNSQNGSEESHSVVETVTATQIAEHAGDEVLCTPEDNDLKPSGIGRDQKSHSVQERYAENPDSKQAIGEPQPACNRESGITIGDEFAGVPTLVNEDAGDKDIYNSEIGNTKPEEMEENKKSISVQESGTENSVIEQKNDESAFTHESVEDTHVAEETNEEAISDHKPITIEFDAIKENQDLILVSEIAISLSDTEKDINKEENQSPASKVDVEPATEKLSTKDESYTSDSAPESAAGKATFEELILRLVTAHETAAAALMLKTY